MTNIATAFGSRSARYLSLSIAASGIFAAMSISLAAPPSNPQARLIDRAAGAGLSAIEPLTAPRFSSEPSAFGFLEFDWSGPDAVPGFGPWRSETASATRATEIARTD